MTASNTAPRRFFEGLLLLIAGILSLRSGVEYLFATEEVFASTLNIFFSGNETSAPAIGLILSAAGAYWLWTAMGLFRGDGRLVVDLRCFFGGNTLLFLSIYCMASTIGELFLDYESALVVYGEESFADEEAFEDYWRATPMIGTVVLAAGAYWFWVAAGLLRGNRKQAENLRCFLGGHTLLAASVFSLISGFDAFFSGESNENVLALFYVTGVVLVPLSAYWFWIATRLLRGDSRPVASLKRFWGGNVLLILGAFGILIGGMIFSLAISLASEFPGDEAAGSVLPLLLGLIFLAWGACAALVAIYLLKGKAGAEKKMPDESQPLPATGEGS